MPLRRLLAAIAAVLLLALPAAAADLASPAGRWRTIDDETNAPRAIVEIAQVGNELRGKIVQLLNPQPGEPSDPVCEKCEGALKGQKVIGMTILWGLRPDEDGEWTGGSVLDPENGKVYRAKLSLADGGRKLKVRGYIGTPLFGRTQTWLRAE
jgi:uncharacterized protein (DUF2147 family)